MMSIPRTKLSSTATAPTYRETNIAAISDRLTKETDALAAETNVNKLVTDLKLIQRTQWVVCVLALFGLAFGIRIHEFCNRGYQPTEVHSKLLLNLFFFLRVRALSPLTSGYTLFVQEEISGGMEDPMIGQVTPQPLTTRATCFICLTPFWSSRSVARAQTW